MYKHVSVHMDILEWAIRDYSKGNNQPYLLGTNDEIQYNINILYCTSFSALQ